MKNDKKVAARAALTKYIEENNCRKTTERFALLDAMYDIDGLFTIEELAERMAVQNFHVSRATLYNSLNLFVKLCLVVKHRFQTDKVRSVLRYFQSLLSDVHHLWQGYRD